MYNENVKMAFIDTLPKNGKNEFAALFALTEERETAYGKDVAEFSREEYIAMVNELGYSQYESVNGAIVKLKRYKKWYAKEYQKDFSFLDFEFGVRDIDLSKRFREQLIYKFDLIINVPPDYKPSNGCVALPFLVFTYYGIDSTDIIKLDHEDVVFSSDFVIVHCNGTKIKITDPTAVKILRDFDQFTEGENYAGANIKRVDTPRFLYKTKRFSKKNEKFETDSGWEYKSILQSVRYFRDNAADSSQYERIDVPNIRSSGMYHRIVNILSKNPEMDFRDVSNVVRGKEIRKVNSDLIRFSTHDYMKAFEQEIRKDYGAMYDTVFRIVSE